MIWTFAESQLMFFRLVVALPTQPRNLLWPRATMIGQHTRVSGSAASDNVNAIYVGSSLVTPSIGFPLAASEEVTIPIDNPGKVYVVSPDGGSFRWFSI